MENMTVDEAFIEVFRELRKVQGITQTSIARRVGTSPQQISDLERHKAGRVSLEMMFKYAGVLNIPVEDFVKRITRLLRKYEEAED